MALSWRESLPQSYSGARKWGTGINPIHGKRGGYEGRNLAPGNEVMPDNGVITEDYGYMPEDIGDGYGVDFSYMDAHPNLNDPKTQRAQTRMPSWGYGDMPTPQGTRKRIVREGMSYKEGHTDIQPRGTAGEGWRNKLSGAVNDANVADESQLFVQTSMRQRDLAKNNNLAQMRGTDDARAEIPSRIVGVRTPVYSGGQRHEDMYPFQQDYRVRPFRYRRVGTGPENWMEVNAENPVTPRQRSVPADVDTGGYETDVITDDGYDEQESWY